MAEQQAIFDAAELSIRFDPTVHQATFKVDLACGVSARVGGPTCNFAPRLVVVESPWSELRRAA